MADKLRWGILSTGAIAGKFASELPESRTGQLLAVGSRTQESANAFADKFNIPRRYGNYGDLLADTEVEAVYIATPHPMHAEWAVKAAEAGKHILCEKPITLNYPDAMALVDAAKQHDVFLMEAFMYRCHPQTAKIVELVKSKVIGEVKMIQASFSFNAGFNPESRLLKKSLGGGGILDVGCYCASMARLVAGAALGKDFADPIEVKSMGHVGEAGTDEYAAALLSFPGEIIAQVTTGVRLTQENSVRVYGTEGVIYVPSPWFCGRDAQSINIYVTRYGEAEPQKIQVEAYAGLYAIEADTVAAHISERQAKSPAMSWNDTLGNIRTLDNWRLGFGMLYDTEATNAYTPTIDNRPLKRHEDVHMQYGRIDGLDKPVARLVMGGVPRHRLLALPYASVLYDEYFRQGGNAFDTAYIYGPSDVVLGQWIRNRGVRDEVVVVAKGAHTPDCYPEALTRQLEETLDRMQTDYVDIYLMHRDNPDIPAGEFIDVLNQHKRAGRIRAFGGSNWSLERVDEASAYAEANGLAPFSAVCNNLSLAEMIDAPWEGCIASSDPKSLRWFDERQMPLLSWSSTSQGFFAWGDPDDLSNPMISRCWYSERNFARLERAKELAARKGVSPVVIAMAYVLNKPFPTFALTGPGSLDELRTSLRVLDLELSLDEMKWLNLEA